MFFKIDRPLRFFEDIDPRRDSKKVRFKAHILSTITMKYSILVTISTLAFLLSGCGPQKPDGFPKLYPISIKVLQEGKPLDNASVSLRLVDESMVWSIGGKTDDKGVAVLWTHGKYQGAPEGKFKVSINKTFNEGEKEMLEAADRNDFAAAAKIPVKSYSFVKTEYNSLETTPVVIDITPKSRMIDVDAGPEVKTELPYMR